MPHHSAIIDIGSNSVRLVVYGGAVRAPAILFNEKISAGLGQGLGADGVLDARSMAATLRALRRFVVLLRDMAPDRVVAVATAAVREAVNGGEFLAEMRATGLDVQVITGDREAELAALGVISAMPDADGIVADLGGGSLELARIGAGRVGSRVSLPLGVLRLAGIRRAKTGPEALKALEDTLLPLLARAGWPADIFGLPLYLVGGSWRTIARFHMAATRYPLPVLHGYTMDPQSVIDELAPMESADRRTLKAISGFPMSRAGFLSEAARLLVVLGHHLRAPAFIMSSAGLREGVLYDRLDKRIQAEDPLIAAAREAGARSGRFDEHGDLLDQWIAPVFADHGAGDVRLRRAACLLADVAWAANPDFRAERGVDIALHGPWTAIDARGRVMMAHALATSFGGDALVPAMRGMGVLASPDDFSRARAWGVAMRLGQRLSAGVAPPLLHSHLSLDSQFLNLRFADDAKALYGEGVERRHLQLAHLLGRTPRRI